MKILQKCLAVVLLLTMTGAMARGAEKAETADTTSYNYFFLEAMTERELGHNSAAFDLLRHCVEICPGASEAYFFLAQYYDVAKDDEKSLACIKRAAELSPDNAYYQEVLAQAYIDNKRPKEAVSALEKLVARDHEREDALETLVDLYRQQEDYPNVLRTLNRLEQLEGRSERLSVAKSEMYTRMGNKKLAISELRQLADQYPNDLNYRGMYADAMLINGQEKKAVAIYRQILAEEPGNIRAQASLRSYYFQQNDTVQADSVTMAMLLNKEATNDVRTMLLRQEVARNEQQGGDSTKVLRFFRTLAAQPRPDADMLMLYAAYMNLKKMPSDSVETVLKRVLEIAPDNAAARLQLVASAWRADSLKRVVSLCAAARQYNPDEMAFYYYQGLAYFKMHDDDNALSAFQNGISVISDKSDPDIVSDFYAIMGDLLVQKGRKQEAYAAYDSCLQWKDDNLGCLNNYAYYLSLEEKDLKRAEQMSLKTVKAEPKNATYLDTYAWILFLQKRYAEARIYIDQALKNDTDSSAVLMEHAGDIYYANKDVDAAVAVWKQAAQKEPDNKLLERKIRQRKYFRK